MRVGAGKLQVATERTTAPLISTAVLEGVVPGLPERWPRSRSEPPGHEAGHAGSMPERHRYRWGTWGARRPTGHREAPCWSESSARGSSGPPRPTPWRSAAR
ncbi:MAG TPA: hypothetical protein VES95_13220 [Dermatophilaceae bacterium]|nr:hypothetical protein [Dermatophilaceae bacterium]